ncbi:MAG: hypothetical protein V2I51_16920, partial [Anderseniella sp.]|nr:hypothetical protein [Anderseniella sp.]
YEREGIPLLWVLSSFDLDRVPQAVSDVVHRHRGNAFVLDQQAVYASREQRTLILLCYLRSDAGFDAPRLVRFDELTFPESRLPYLEDRLFAEFFETIKQQRQLYFEALRALGDQTKILPVQRLTGFEKCDGIAWLIAAAFSLLTAAEGRFENFSGRSPNIKAMLNGYLAPGHLTPYAKLLHELIQNSSLRPLLDGSVGVHLNRSFASAVQVEQSSAEWQLLKELFPEALNPIIRLQLQEAKALPAWADPDRPA